MSCALAAESGTESNGSETFACGGFNCRDRHFRHLKEGSPICEHPGCEVVDTPSHRLYTCTATDPHRLNTSWTQDQTDMTKANGVACHHYGMWALPTDWVRDLASTVMALVDFDFIQQAVSLARRVSVRFTPAAMPSRILKLWYNNFPSRRNSASVGVVTHSFVCSGQEVSKTFILRDHLRDDDVHWLSHVLAMCLRSLLHCQIHHWGVKPKISWGSRDKSRSDFWASIRAQLPFGIENRILDSPDAG
eukprot:1880230-Amphidinium_carterae.1